MTQQPLKTFQDRLANGDFPGAAAALREALVDVAPRALPRVALAGVALARRRGTSPDARVWLRDARRALERLPDDEQRELLPDLLLAEAVAAVERGADLAAERLLQRGLDLTRLQPGDACAHFHRALGTLAARKGRASVAASHYRLALDRMDPDQSPDAVAQLWSNLARTAWMRGAVAEALAWVDEALAWRGRPGAPPGPHANSRAMRAMITGADADWEQATALAQASGDIALLSEVALEHAIVARRRGEAARADALEALGTARLVDVGRQEPTLLAIAAEARAARCRGEDRVLALAEAAGLYEELGASWHEHRVQLLLAAAEHGLGLTETATARAARAVRRAMAQGHDFPPDPGVVEVVLAAAAAGHAGAARWARERGWRAPSSSLGAVLDPARGTVTLQGEPRHLGPRALTFRLLWLLARAGPRGLTTTELCRRLWRSDPAGPAVLGRLRVLVGRVRALTEPGLVVVLTVPGVPTRYRWNPELRWSEA